MAAYGLLILPESLATERRRPFRFAGANVWRSFHLLAEQPAILALVAVLVMMMMMMMMAATCLPATLMLYTDYRFGWSTAAIGLYRTFAGAGHLLVQSLLVKRIVRRFGERTAAVTGYVSAGIGFVIFASVKRGALFFNRHPVYALAGLVTSAVQSQLTQLVARDKQGQLQGVVAGFKAWRRCWRR